MAAALLVLVLLGLSIDSIQHKNAEQPPAETADMAAAPASEPAAPPAS